MTDEIKIELPAAAEYLRLARLAAGDMGARAGFRYEEIDDLKIAIDELCHAITVGEAAARLAIVFEVSDRQLEVTGSCERDGSEPSLSELAAAILAAVVDTFDVDAESGVSRFRFVKTVGSP